MTLAQAAGLHELLGEHLRVVSPNVAIKSAGMIGRMLAGVDSINDPDVLRHGGMRRVSLRGGNDAIPGTILAELLLGVLQNGLTILNVNSFWQDIAQGFLLVVAVIIQQRRGGAKAIGLP